MIITNYDRIACILIARQVWLQNVMGDIQIKTIAEIIALCNQSCFLVNLKIKMMSMQTNAYNYYYHYYPVKISFNSFLY